ncbi:hypothetical protein A8926_5984 [Saccharopolyspora spinosa]|uniref:Uncharacterized protein n=1 Tax=Saccharopolyspora spinosa TaxID=60894 RepID=A0A2N3Y4T4_SACSN|nr:hypothetical protein A8926_5984 [Saccharopolyspora spinosa]
MPAKVFNGVVPALLRRLVGKDVGQLAQGSALAAVAGCRSKLRGRARGTGADLRPFPAGQAVAR